MSFIKTYGRCYQKFDNNPIIKTDPTYIAPTAKENLEYTGEAQALLNAGSTNDGIIKYSLDGTNWDISVPTGTEALTYTCYWKLEGDANHNDVAQASISVEIASVTPAHEYVEIGGIKWATMNIGASQPSDYGLYFAWGDTQGYTAEQVGEGEGQKYFGWADYKYGNGTSSPDATGMIKYNATDGKTVLEASDDAAVANWGGSWRMPTTAEFQALGAAVNTEWTDDYQGSGVAGILCTDETDSSKTLFFPAAGDCYNGSVDVVGNSGYCWSSSLFTDNRQLYAYSLFFDSGDACWDDGYERCFGFAVRPILDE